MNSADDILWQKLRETLGLPEGSCMAFALWRATRVDEATRLPLPSGYRWGPAAELIESHIDRPDIVVCRHPIVFLREDRSSRGVTFLVFRPTDQDWSEITVSVAVVRVRNEFCGIRLEDAAAFRRYYAAAGWGL